MKDLTPAPSLSVSPRAVFQSSHPFDAAAHTTADAPLGEANSTSSVNTVMPPSTTIMPCAISSARRLANE